MLIFILGLLVSFAAAGRNPCLQKDLPISRAKVCKQIKKFDKASREHHVPRGVPQVYSKKRGLVKPSNLFDCQDIPCICSFIQGAQMVSTGCRLPDGGIYGKCLRKDLRMLSDAERNLYKQALWSGQNDIYHQISAWHSNVTSSVGAHSGPNFAGWHREMLKRLEMGIRTKNINGRYPFVSVCLPYWDSTADNELRDLLRVTPSNSVTFCEEIMGTQRNGTLNDGMFKGFGSTAGPTRRELDRWPGTLSLLKRGDVQDLIASNNIDDFLMANAGDESCPDVPFDNIELLHGDVHVWVGGNMEDIATASNDPIFFLHHGMVDNIFEQWRQRAQSRQQREIMWSRAPKGCYSSAHMPDAIMIPFGQKTNLDGLSNSYTDNLYSYAPQPRCNRQTPCPSKYLWCNVQAGTCVPRLRAGAPCGSYYGVDPCYGSTCEFGTCR